MTFHDKHLKQALKNAPDNDLSPNATVKQRVLQYATQAATPKTPWYHQLKNWVASWHINNMQLAGIGSLAGIFLVVVMIWKENPQDQIWTNAAPEQLSAITESEVTAITQSDAIMSTPKLQGQISEANPSQPLPRTDIVKKERSHPAEERAEKPHVGVDIASTSVAPAMPPMAANANVGATIAERKLTEEVVAAKPITSEITTEQSAEFGARPKQGTSIPELAKAAVPKELPAKKETNSSQLATALMKEGGFALATKDIQAKKPRILKINQICEATAHAPQIDPSTDLPIEVLDICENLDLISKEIANYNNTTRLWYEKEFKQQ